MRAGPEFVSEALAPSAECIDTGALSRGEPPLPREFGWRGERLVVGTVRRTWRSTTTDRGDVYLARHWFEVLLADGRSAVLYFDRKSRRDRPHWWLYTIEAAGAAGSAP
ncbi:MAG TPA: DUF6504 family protein [Candidatus Elarobacter sp.]|jgi:hypothetical protein